MNLEQKLKDHILSVEGKAVVWGKDDCTSFAADWVDMITGIRIPRIPFKSMEEAHALIEEKGSLLKIWEEALIFFPESYNPQLGEVGLIQTHRFGLVGCIFGTDGVAFWRANQGVGLLRPREYVKAWRLISD